MKNFTTFKRELLKDKIIHKAYDVLDAEFVLAGKLIQKRLACGLTQAELAKKIGTKQSAIARLESGHYNPTVLFLDRVARGLASRVKISIS